MATPAEVVRCAFLLVEAEDEVRRHKQVIAQGIGDV
jgi:hypothetical protein